MFMAASWAVLIRTTSAMAQPSVQQSCDTLRVKAWTTFRSCIERVIARDAKGILVDYYAPFARCRHPYFKKWVGFQVKSTLQGSTCIGPRFTDNGDQTMTDRLTGLVWEKKQNRDGTEDLTNAHDADNGYLWTAGNLRETGSVFTDFLTNLNAGGGFAGSNGWRLPTIVELQTILRDYACSGAGLSPQCDCTSIGCADPAFESDSQFVSYCSATTDLPYGGAVWIVDFLDADVVPFPKTLACSVRAVRGGL